MAGNMGEKKKKHLILSLKAPEKEIQKYVAVQSRQKKRRSDP